MTARELVVEADGGSRGNPGVAGYGALVRDAAGGELLAERAEPLGRESNNVAEYRGLIAGLTAAVQIDPGARIHVRMDSRLVIEQMSGHWKIKHPDMRKLATAATAIVRSVREAGGEVTWEWIPRERNKHADKLSNDGMDGKTVTRDPWRSGTAAGEPRTDPAPSDDAAAAPADLTTPARLLLVRHAATDHTASGRIGGRGGSDPGLSADGREQARLLAGSLADRLTGRVAVVTSTLRRARQTGTAIADALGVRPEAESDWDEQTLGDWDGLTHRQIEQAAPGSAQRLRTDPQFAPPAGESFEQLRTRVQHGYRTLLDAAPAGSAVVLVTHRVPIVTLLGGLLGITQQRMWMLQVDPASISEVRVWQDRHAAVSRLNDCAHLPGRV